MAAARLEALKNNPSFRAKHLAGIRSRNAKRLSEIPDGLLTRSAYAQHAEISVWTVDSMHQKGMPRHQPGYLDPVECDRWRAEYKAATSAARISQLAECRRKHTAKQKLDKAQKDPR
jgi:hypothetical protein